MVERIPNLPDTVLGFTARGRVTATDCETVIIPAVQGACSSATARSDSLTTSARTFSGLDAGAMWDDHLKLGLQRLPGGCWREWLRSQDVEWIRAAVRVFGLAMPGHVRFFHNRELAGAARWVSA